MESWNIVDNADDAGNVGDAGTSELEPLKALAKAPHVAGSNSRKKLSFNGVRRPPHIVFTPFSALKRRIFTISHPTAIKAI